MLLIWYVFSQDKIFMTVCLFCMWWKITAAFKYNSVYKQSKAKYLRHDCYPVHNDGEYTQRRVQQDKCYFTIQITGSNFECSL